MRRILFVTGTRADYGLLRKLMLTFEGDTDFETHVAVTGAHLSKVHGNTVDVVKADKFKNLHEVSMDLGGDTPKDISRGIAKEMSGFSELFEKLKPELMVILGDRYEIWAPAIAATVYNVPIAHIHGGETTIGVIDEAVRHSLTKMSHLHFCSHEEYKKRIVRMGENPARVFNVGAVGLDRILDLPLLDKASLGKKLNIQFGEKNILCTFHPITLDAQKSTIEVNSLVDALRQLLKSHDSYKLFITLPNADTYSGPIRDAWEKLLEEFKNQAFSFVSLGDLNYLSFMKHADVVLGNSSSGILEAPYFGTPVVNVGRRQEGRLTSAHVIHSNGSQSDIVAAIEKALSVEFKNSVSQAKSIYGQGNSSQKIYDEIKKVNFQDLLFKKFFDGEVR